MVVKKTVSGVSLSLIGLSVFCSTCYSQQQPPSSDDDVQLDQIVVTSRKRAESILDVPFSVSAPTEEELRNLGARSLEEISQNVAGFTVQNLGPGQSQVAIRGVSAGQIVRDQPGVKEQVGIYLDESVISLSLFTPDLDFYDVERVEVLRGPQGTLFGSGSLSGTVRYISNKPILGEFQFSGETGGNLIDEGESDQGFKTMVNLPLGDNLALRAVGYYSDFGGFIDSVRPDFSSNDNVNDGERIGGRVALLWRPNDALSIMPRIIYQEVEVDGFNRVDDFNILANPFTQTRPPVTLGSRDQFTQFNEEFTDEFILFDTTVEYDLGSMLFTSVTSYTDREVLQLRDATQLTASITAQPDILNQGEAVFTLDAPLDDGTDIEVFTQEFRLVSQTDSPLQWVFGVFYSDIEREYGQSLNVAGFENLSGIPTQGVISGQDILFFSDIPYKFEQFALFGEASYALTDQLELTFGLRYFDFNERRKLNFDGIFADQTINQRGKTSSDDFSPRLILSYALNDDVRLNAQVSKGFRLGGINDPLNEPLCSPQDLATFGGRPSFDDEELINYEIGAKIRLMEGRGLLNVAVFHSEINDLQATLDAGTCSSRIIFNVPDASSTGIELELAGQVTDNLSLSLASSYVDTELDTTVNTTDLNGVTTVVGGIEDGNRLPTTPRFQFSASATYAKNLFQDWQGFVVGSYRYIGDRFTQIGDQADGFENINLNVTPIGAPNQANFNFDAELPSYQIVNLRFGVRSTDLEVAFFINNLTDERALLGLDRERGGRARVGFLTNQPRTYGINARLLF